MPRRGLEPDVFTFHAVIEALDAASQAETAMVLMSKARSQGLYPKAWASDIEVDLHDCSAAVARTIMRCLLQDLRSGVRLSGRSLTVVTGRGNNSDGGKAVLPSEIREFLVECKGPAFTDVLKNPGRFVLRKESLRSWVDSFGELAK